MANSKAGNTPTEEDILSYDNVPVSVAAAYIGTSMLSIRKALIQKRAPYGYAVQNEDTDTWSYQISPGLLVKYKNGEFVAWALNDAVQLLVAEIERVLDLRSKAAIEVLCPGLLRVAEKPARNVV